MKRLRSRSDILEKRRGNRQKFKKVRGTCLDIKDRVLIANKGERGKRKLADKWDPAVYSVVDRNLQTHTYKLKDEKGNVRVVHRNLMLDISFLPVESPDEEESILLSARESEDETHSARIEFVVEDVDPADLEERTMRWVNQESESPLVQESESNLVQNFDVEEAMCTDHNILDRKESSDQLQIKIIVAGIFLRVKLKPVQHLLTLTLIVTQIHTHKCRLTFNLTLTPKLQFMMFRVLGQGQVELLRK